MINFEIEETINKGTDIFKDLQLLATLSKKAVLVGVPAPEDEKKPRKGNISNASLAYIHNNGSPLQGIPARPFMKPGIEKVQDKIDIEFREVTKAILNRKPNDVDKHLKMAGFIASSSIKNVINEGEGFEPLKYGTLLGRLREAKSYKGKRKKLKRLKGKGDTTAYNELANSMGAEMASFHPLIDTAQLRNSITYVVENGS
jgi:hypothetical protein